MSSIIGREMCGCAVERKPGGVRIVYCDLHAAAGEMREALQGLKVYQRHRMLCPQCRKGNLCPDGLQLWATSYDRRDAALASARGEAQ